MGKSFNDKTYQTYKADKVTNKKKNPQLLVAATSTHAHYFSLFVRVTKL